MFAAWIFIFDGSKADEYEVVVVEPCLLHGAEMEALKKNKNDDPVILDLAC